MLDEHGEEIAIDRSPIARSCSITYKLLDQIKIPGDDKAGLLEKLKYALQIDMDVDFNEDELEVAWQNPNNFWGHKEMMCRIRTDVEMSKILEFLRVAHLVEPENESTVFLFLVGCQSVFIFHANMTSARGPLSRRITSILHGPRHTLLRSR